MMENVNYIEKKFHENNVNGNFINLGGATDFNQEIDKYDVINVLLRYFSIPVLRASSNRMKTAMVSFFARILNKNKSWIRNYVNEFLENCQSFKEILKQELKKLKLGGCLDPIEMHINLLNRFLGQLHSFTKAFDIDRAKINILILIDKLDAKSKFMPLFNLNLHIAFLIYITDAKDYKVLRDNVSPHKLENICYMTNCKEKQLFQLKTILYP
ncbi:MAG: hypothetical protein ACTSXH_13110 [Promethearchaeota archaeon]